MTKGKRMINMRQGEEENKESRKRRKIGGEEEVKDNEAED